MIDQLMNIEEDLDNIARELHRSNEIREREQRLNEFRLALGDRFQANIDDILTVIHAGYGLIDFLDYKRFSELKHILRKECEHINRLLKRYEKEDFDVSN